MAATAISELVYLLDEVFQGTQWHSLLVDLKSLSSEDWRWVPRGGHRSIRDIVQHVAGCKFMYQNHGFGNRALAWDDPLVDGSDALQSMASAIEWLRAGQQRLQQSIAALDDADLLRPR